MRLVRFSVGAFVNGHRSESSPVFNRTDRRREADSPPPSPGD
jgi:hypothetical protein